MLKSVSSVTNAIGALNYKGTWNASTNTPDLAASSPDKGDYYVVSVAGTTTLGGISTWYVGDWAVYNGAVWQRVEGGDDDPAPSVRSNSTTGVMEITGPAAASTRVMTIPDANFTAARTDAGQTFTGDQTVAGNVTLNAQGDLRFADTDSSNYVAFQAPGTIAADVTWTLPDVDGTSGQVLATNGTGTLSWATATLPSQTGNEGQALITDGTNASWMPQGFGFRNRIINGDMRIDQRNAGASVTPISGQYLVDRWVAQLTQTSKFSVQQNAASVTPPAGFSNYLGVTSSSAYSVLTGDTFLIDQRIEGFNFADCNWGTANAKTVTLSFWVRSSLTGNFGGALSNSASNRSYPFTYAISTADTWEYKTVTVAGDTTGTWVGSTNGIGLMVRFGLGSGSTFTATAGSWGAGNIVQPTGSVSVVGTSGATWFVTGVQLEVGSVATPFERRPYGQELSLCERYYQGNKADGTTSGNRAIFRGNNASLTGNFYYWFPFGTEMRTNPTMNVGTPSYSNASSAAFVNIQRNGAEFLFNVSSGGGYAFVPWRAEAEL